MPELLEVDTYRRQAEAAVGRTIVAVDAPDAWFVKGATPAEVAAAVTGTTVVAVRRRGKLLVLDLVDAAGGPGEAAGSGHGGAVAGEASGGGPGEPDVRLGLRFGMTGRLLVDGAAAIERLQHASGRDEPAWDRFVLRFAGGTELRLRDPRRLGGVMLDPDEGLLGVDALEATPEDLRRALGASAAPLKARLLDQSRVAGIGNLLADEILWRAGLDPARPAGSLDGGEVEALAEAVTGALVDLGGRGGSHTGDLRRAVALDGRCPRDGASLRRRTIGGRTTWSCPAHQR